MPRSDDARARLAAMKREVPTPTPEAVALDKKELASRKRGTRYERFVNDMGKRPDLSAAIHIGEPTMVDPPGDRRASSGPKITSPATPTEGSGAIKVETAGGAPTENQPAPRSQIEAAAANPSDAPAQPLPQLNESQSGGGTRARRPRVRHRPPFRTIPKRPPPAARRSGSSPSTSHPRSDEASPGAPVKRAPGCSPTGRVLRWNVGTAGRR